MKQTYSVSEAAAILGLCEITVRRRIRSKELPGYVLGESQFVIPIPALDAFLRGEWQPAPKPAAPTPIGLVRRKAS